MFILRFLARRLFQGAIIVFLVSALIFTLLRVVPGDPVRLMAGGMAPEALIEQIATDMGLRDPIWQQFGRYMGGVVQGDLVLAGGGDPTLDTDTLADMARRLKAAGVREVRGQFKVWGGALPQLHQIDGD